MAEKYYEPHKKIEPIDGLDPQRQVPLDTKVEDLAASEEALKVRFDDAFERMHAKPSRPVGEVALEDAVKAQKPSPMDVMRSQNSSVVQPVPSHESIRQQALDLRESFERPRAVLMQGGFVTKSSLPTLTTHIEHADRALQEAASAAKGVEVGSLLAEDKPPLVRFLHFLTDGDKQLSNIVGDIGYLNRSGQKMTPQLLLAVQMKLGFVQQELEFFINILGKSIEATKTVMNVQI